MRFVFAIGLLLVGLATWAYAQSTQTFSSYISGLTAASTPITGNDTLYILQGGNSRSVTTTRLGIPGIYTLNVQSLGALGNGTTDDSAALSAAVTQAVAYCNAGKRSVIYLPVGTYRIVTAPPTLGPCPVTIQGDGLQRTYITLDTAFTGDLFSWSDAWYNANWPQYTPTVTNLPQSKAGPSVRDITILGNTTTANVQNVFMFYDHTDAVLFQNVEVQYIHGRCLGMGIIKNTASAYIRESKFYNTRFSACGTTTLAAVELATQGTPGDASDATDFYGMDIFAPASQGLLIRNQNTNSPIRTLRFFGLRVEGASPARVGAAADLLQIGDSTYAGGIRDIAIYGFVGAGSIAGLSTIGVYGISAAKAPFDINIEGTITSGAGQGINVAAGRSLRFKFDDIATTQTKITVGAAPLTAASIQFDGNGAETAWLAAATIDASATGFVKFPTVGSCPC